MELLKQLCEVPAPSGNEVALKNFIIDYVREHQAQWRVSPTLIDNEDLRDSLTLVFGTPRTAVLAHMDSVGFMVRYHDQLISIGSPKTEDGYRLVGADHLGPVECELAVYESKKVQQLRYQFGRALARGTELTFACDFRETTDFVQTCYLDNRLGVYNALRQAETLENGLLVFTCGEEQGGGSVPYLARFIHEQFGVKQYLISDVSWTTDGVVAGQGAVVSMRDRLIPRRSFLNKIIGLAEASKVPFQLEVEATGASDARELLQAPYPVDWCFVGAPVAYAHSPNEKVHRADVDSMLALYQYLLQQL
ncbi:MAG: M20/M25/M40 family metallo-hydrolase [Tunicatimonas sp.]